MAMRWIALFVLAACGSRTPPPAPHTTPAHEPSQASAAPPGTVRVVECGGGMAVRPRACEPSCNDPPPPAPVFAPVAELCTSAADCTRESDGMCASVRAMGASGCALYQQCVYRGDPCHHPPDNSLSECMADQVGGPRHWGQYSPPP